MLRGPEEQVHIPGLISTNFRWVCSEAVSKEIEERVAQNVAAFLQFNGCLCSTVARMKAACIQIPRLRQQLKQRETAIVQLQAGLLTQGCAWFVRDTLSLWNACLNIFEFLLPL